MTVRYRYIDAVTEEGIELFIEEYTEVKKTPRGVWVQRRFGHHNIGKKRFVLDGDGRRLCHQTLDKAWESYKARKRKQFSMAKDSLKRAEFVLTKIAEIGAPPSASIVLGKPYFWNKYIFD